MPSIKHFTRNNVIALHSQPQQNMLLCQRTKAYSTLIPGRVVVTKATSYVVPDKVLTGNIAFDTVHMKQ